jgi:hypothetical protein
MGNPIGILADIQAISDDSAELAKDQADLMVLQAQVDSKAAEIESDTTASTAANQKLSDDLVASGPVYVLNPDSTVSLYQFSAVPPGFMITTAKLAD